MSAATWFFNVRTGWKAIIAIAGIFGAGLTVGTIVSGAVQVPERVAALEIRADSLTDQLYKIQRDVAELSRNNTIQLCLQIAEKRKTDWQECLK